MTRWTNVPIICLISIPAFSQQIPMDSLSIFNAQDIMDSLREPVQELEQQQDEEELKEEELRQAEEALQQQADTISVPPQTDSSSVQTPVDTASQQNQPTQPAPATTAPAPLPEAEDTATALNPEIDSIGKIPRDSAWHSGGNIMLNLNQIGFQNWAQGGENGMSTAFIAGLFLDYKRKKITWDNRANIYFGLITVDDYEAIRKNDDRFEASTKLGVSAFKKIYYSALASFLTQFAPGYDYLLDETTPISLFMSPAYLTMGVGMDWQPNDHFSLFLSPATGRITYIMDDEIAATGLYGNKPAVLDSLGDVIEQAENIRREFGALISMTLDTKLGKSVMESAKISLFNNYTDPDPDTRRNIDVHLMNNISFTHHKFFTTTIYFELIYDHDVLLPTYEKINGVTTQVGVGPKSQIKEIIGLNFSYFFGDAKM